MQRPLLLSGNQAVARGAYESGVRFATGYPGTPSTEVVESLSTYANVHATWSVNEKVAMESALGAALAGARSIVAMKHVGLNVAADPLFSASYTGIRAGFVIVVGDDPSANSSQNEQDSRHYARAAKLPFLEPADSQEAKDFVIAAFALSERFDTPVIIRLTTRVCHSQCRVSLGSEIHPHNDQGPFVPDFDKYVLLPRQAVGRHIAIEKRQEELAAYSDDTDLNREEFRDTSLGIITSGVCYSHVREAFPDASVFKLGQPYPLPQKRMSAFADKVDRVLVVEELDGFLESEIAAAGIAVDGKRWVPRVGELTPQRLRSSFDAGAPQPIETGDPSITPRAPRICAGCQYLGIYTVISKLNLTVCGDIGCYTLGAFSPWNGIDTVLCMGASISMAAGMEKVGRTNGDQNNVLAVIGDGTFLHSGVPALMDLVYNQGRTTVLILDNATTAMTGLQGHPGNGEGLQGGKTKQVDLEKLCEAIGIEWVEVVDPYDMDATESTLREAIAYPGPSVVISRAPCLLLEKRAPIRQAHVDAAACTGCGDCFSVGCIAVEKYQTNGSFVADINHDLCVGCGLCVQSCPEGAIAPRLLTDDPDLVELSLS